MTTRLVVLVAIVAAGLSAAASAQAFPMPMGFSSFSGDLPQDPSDANTPDHFTMHFTRNSHLKIVSGLEEYVQVHCPGQTEPLNRNIGLLRPTNYAHSTQAQYNKIDGTGHFNVKNVPVRNSSWGAGSKISVRGRFVSIDEVDVTIHARDPRDGCDTGALQVVMHQANNR